MGPGHDHTGARDVVELADLFVGGNARYVPICQICAQMPDRIGSISRLDGGSYAGPLAVGSDQHVVSASHAVGKPHGDGMLVLFEVFHRLPENVLDAIPGCVVEDSDQISPHDLVLGSHRLRAFARGIGHNSRLGSALSIHEGESGFMDPLAANGFKQSHTLKENNTLVTNVDLGACGSQNWKTLDDGNMMAGSGEPEG